MNPTKLLYLEDWNLHNAEAKVLEVQSENDKHIIVLDQTIFYPQGGGQPYDQGVIATTHGNFSVEEVRFKDGIVYHIGTFTSHHIATGETVTCTIDGERRALHSRLHSAGHVVDMAITSLKFPWIPGKGYHFPQGQYVEYTGTLGDIDKDKLKNDIENICNEITKTGQPTRIIFMDKEKMHEVCHHVPDYLPTGKPTRVVMYGSFGVPCGGTHVNNLQDIGPITIRKIKQEGPSIRISYAI